MYSYLLGRVKTIIFDKSYIVALEIMAVRNCKLLWSSSMIMMMLKEGLIGRSRFYRSNPKMNLKKLRPMILKRIEDRAKDYPVKPMVPVAQEVLQARSLLIQGVSTLLQVYTVWACKHCPEVYVGEKGHLIRNCGGYKQLAKNQIHDWIHATLNDVIVPVETFHLHKMFQNIIKHNQRFDFDRIPAVVELCLQAGVDPTDEILISDNLKNSAVCGVDSLSLQELKLIGQGTLRAWETVLLGVKKLLLVYPSKVCKYCSEVHVGPSGHNARLCGVFKYESWRGTHFWQKAEVDNLVPQKVMWFRRPQDPPLLVDSGRDYYGHAPVVVDLCTKTGIVAPSKYSTMMKLKGLAATV